MKKICITLCMLAGSWLAAADEWNENTGFADWTKPFNSTASYEGKHLTLTATANDCGIWNRKVDIDPKEYEGFEIEYKLTGKVSPTDSGQIYFAGADGKLHGRNYWVIEGLTADGNWHTARVTRVFSGMKNWNAHTRITALRFDPFNFGRGTLEIRAIRMLKKANVITPGDKDIGYGSSAHPHLWRIGMTGKNPHIVGKGNRFDHRYRFLVRLPLDKLLAKGSVQEAVLEFNLSLFVGTQKSRVYIIEAIDEDIQALKANDLNQKKVIPLGKVELSRANVKKTVRIDVTPAVNHALSKVYSGVTIRIRPEIEANKDPGASGAGIKAPSIKLRVR